MEFRKMNKMLIYIYMFLKDNETWDTLSLAFKIKRYFVPHNFVVFVDVAESICIDKEYVCR